MTSISTKISLSGSFFTSSRLIYAAGRERYLPAVFGRLHKTRGTPLNATILQAAITIAFILAGGGFRALINFAVLASWAFYFLTVSMLFNILVYNRFEDFLLGSGCGNITGKRAYVGKVGKARCYWCDNTIDGTSRPYKTWIITPLTFCAVRIADESNAMIPIHP